MLCAVALLLSPLPRPELARAVGFTVETTQDAPHDLPLNGNCTSTLGPGGVGGPCTLRAAVQAANFLGGAQTINLPAGAYVLTVTGAEENAAATGDLDITGNITILGAGRATTVIDGNHTDRVFEVGPTSSAQLTMADGTVQNGTPPETSEIPPIAQHGGGIRLSSTSIATLTNVNVSRNATAHLGMGAGIYSQGTMTLNNVIVSDNNSDTQGGGLELSGTTTLTRVTVNGNTASGPFFGGGIHNVGYLLTCSARWPGARPT
jgi:CSLREA domain-containing protein